MSNKVPCLGCSHCHFDGGSPDYSELTPGWAAEMRCQKGHWEIIFHHGVDEGEYQQALAKGATCEDYELNPEIKQMIAVEERRKADHEEMLAKRRAANAKRKATLAKKKAEKKT